MWTLIYVSNTFLGSSCWKCSWLSLQGEESVHGKGDVALGVVEGGEW
jgi:hypothetical protein